MSITDINSIRSRIVVMKNRNLFLIARAAGLDAEAFDLSRHNPTIHAKNISSLGRSLQEYWAHLLPRT